MQLVLLLLVGIQASIAFTHNGGSVTKGNCNMRKLSSRGNKCLPCMIVDFAEKTIQLGDKLEISPMGVGAWAWGDKAYWTYDSSQEAAAKEAFSKSLLYGLNLFDTAEVYGLGTEWGHSEILCGRFAREMQVKAVSVPSQEVIIATKFAPIPLRTSRESVLKALRESLERIGADKCDLYQLHWPSFFFDAQYWDGLADAFDAGLVRAVGVSNYSAKRHAAAHRALAARGIPLASNQVYLRLRADPFGGCTASFLPFAGLLLAAQVQYSLVHRTPEANGVQRACEDLGVRLLAYSPLGQGLLTGVYRYDRKLLQAPCDEGRVRVAHGAHLSSARRGRSAEPRARLPRIA